MSASVWRFIIFGILGFSVEVVFTAIHSLIRDRSWRLRGYSFVWMFPIYGVIAFAFEPVYNIVAGQVWLVRGLAYVLLIYLVEYISGALLKKVTGGHIWHYKGRYQLHGHINFLYAPFWFIAGMLIEKHYDNIARLSVWLSGNFG